ncbi:MAG: hypothetical protein SFV20_09915 [Sphingopyxis sp.]|nr:hypothetical protein [Sphingopyxis sp.]
MLNVLSILIGAVALLLAIPATVPFFGWANWIILPIAAFGFLLGLMSDRKSGQIFCAVVMGICALRLFLGGGIF